MASKKQRMIPVLRRLQRASLLQRFAVTSLAVFILLGLALALILGQRVQSIAVAEARQTAYENLHAQLLHHISPQDLTQRLAGGRYRIFDKFVRNSILSDRTIRVKVWNRRGTIEYSNDRAIVGHTFPITDELSAALHGELASEVSDLSKSENRDEHRYGKLLEVYIPIQYRPGGKIFGAFEIYQTYGPVARQIDSLRHSGDALVGGGLLVLYGLLFGLVRRGSNTIIEQQRRLLKSEERFRSLVQNASDVITVIDADGTVRYQTPSVARVFGYAFADLDGTRLTDLVQPDDIPRTRSFLVAATERSGVSERHECRLRHRDGSWLYTEIVATNLLDDPNVRGIVLTIRDIGERKRAEHILEHQALHDSLTDLPNRSLLHDRLQQAIAIAECSGTSLALLLMDLDRFKEINDTFGHHYGDLLLRQLGPRLHEALRESNTVARLGGDEFAILLPDTDTQRAIHAAEQILRTLGEPFDVETHSLDVTGSLGIALYPEHGTDPNTLLQRADVAMYHAKRTDTGYAVYAAQQDEYSPDRLLIIGELRQAIEQDQLLLYYQPQINLKTGRLEGVEALVRWRHPERGIIPPDQFISLAEHTGLIRPLTTWVLNRALQQCRDWRTAGLDLKVAVNLSARSLHDPQLIGVVETLLATWNVAADCLELELTETALMADPTHGVEILTHLHEMGVKIALDDYGTGYSSLTYLKQLPLDAIKIDRSFVVAMRASEGDGFIVRSVADLAHSLGMEVVAEGVEDEQTLHLLTLMGCDLAQGYHLGRPLPCMELFSWATTTQVTVGT